jgi:2,5-diketo-D-gluconate reductase B
VPSKAIASPEDQIYFLLEGQRTAHKKTTAQICLRYLVQQNVVVIPRTSKVERLSENAAIFDFTLSEREMRDIAALGHRDGRIVDWSYSGRMNWD